MAAEFKLRQREQDLLTPEVEVLVGRADEALDQDRLQGAADLFIEIARIVDPMVARRPRGPPHRDDLDPFFIPFFPIQLNR